jgi:hypothetical protein
MEHGQGSGEGHGKRKQLASKHKPKRGRGQASYVPSDRTVDEDFVEEQRIDSIGRTIPVIVDSPPHISMFDDSYMRDSNSVFVFIPPHDNDNHKVLNYSLSVKKVAEAREINPYAEERNDDLDYRFGNAFQSNFYATAILSKKKGKISNMQFIDFGDLQGRKEFNVALTTCDRLDLTEIMGFRHDWNKKVLAQFHATYF